MKRAILLIVTMVFIIGGLSVVEAGKKEPILIGAIYGLTSPAADEAEVTSNSAILAVEERKKILGRPIKLIMEDAPNATAGISAAKRLITVKNVLCLLGTTFVDNAKAIGPICHKYGVPILEDDWDPMLTEQGWKPYFMIGQTYDVYMRGAADRIVEYFAPMLGKKPEELRIAYVYDDWSTYCAEVFLPYLKEKYGIEPVYVGHFPWGITDFTPVIEQIKAKGPIDIFMPMQTLPPATLFRKQMIALEFKPKIIFALGISWEKYPFVEALGAEVTDGIFAWSWPLPEMNYKPMKKYRKKYEKRFGKPSGPVGPVTYSAMLVLLDTIEKVLKEHGKVDRDLLGEALYEADVPEGVLPVYWGFKWNKKGINLRAGTCNIMQWQDGKRGIVWPEKVATGKPKRTW